MNCTNLDYLCAKYGQNIPKSKEHETIIQKSLGVLQEDGLFAFILFLESKNENITSYIMEETAKILNETGLTEEANKKNIKENILKLTENIDDMFLAKELIEKTLVYARYHAKTLKNK